MNLLVLGILAFILLLVFLGYIKGRLRREMI